MTDLILQELSSIYVIHHHNWLETFTNSLQYKNANTANFVLAIPWQINPSNKVCVQEMAFW